MTGFGFGKGPPLTDEQRAVHNIRADETLALRARISELEAALQKFIDYDSADDDDGNLMMLDYIDAIETARAALGEKDG